jgi:hypothetical protein
MSTPHKLNPDRIDGAMVSMSHSQLTNAANALWNFAVLVDAIKGNQTTAEPVQWFDCAAVDIQGLYDTFTYALTSLEAVKKVS